MRKERYKFIKPSVLVVVKAFTYLKEQGRPEMKTCSSYLKKCVLAAFRNLSQTVNRCEEKLEASSRHIRPPFGDSDCGRGSVSKVQRRPRQVLVHAHSGGQSKVTGTWPLHCDGPTSALCLLVTLLGPMLPPLGQAAAQTSGDHPTPCNPFLL